MTDQIHRWRYKITTVAIQNKLTTYITPTVFVFVFFSFLYVCLQKMSRFANDAIQIHWILSKTRHFLGPQSYDARGLGSSCSKHIREVEIRRCRGWWCDPLEPSTSPCLATWIDLLLSALLSFSLRCSSAIVRDSKTSNPQKNPLRLPPIWCRLPSVSVDVAICSLVCLSDWRSWVHP